MTASLYNQRGGNFANVVDDFTYPVFIGIALRAPTTQDIYPAGTRWQDNSVSPPVIYQTSGAGVWVSTPGGGPGTFTSLTVDPGNIDVPTGSINVPNGVVTTSQVTFPGPPLTNIMNDQLVTNGDFQISATSGMLEIVGDSVQINADGTGIIDSLANIQLSTTGTKIIMQGGAATDFIGTATLAAGTVTVANTNIDANDRIFITYTGTGLTNTGQLSYTITPATSFTIESTNGADANTVVYFIVREI